jgi:hypothetical protein
MKEVSRRTILRGGATVATAVIVNRIGAAMDAPEAAAEHFLAVAYNEAIITPVAPPWPGLWMGGYGWGQRANDGSIARDLRAHCVCFSDTGTPNVLLRLDIVSLPRDVHLEIRRRVVEEEELVADADFMINTSHTHSGPFIGDTHPDPVVLIDLAPEDVDAVNGTTFMLIDLLVDLVRTTVQERSVMVSLSYGVGQAELGYNRAGLDTVLTDVPVLVLSEPAGDPFAVLFGCACHPVSRGGDHTFDSDFTGSAAETITERTGLMAMFFQGLAGDQNPIDGGSPERVEELGDVLADAVIEVLEQGRRGVGAPFSNKITTIDLPFGIDLTDPDVVAELRDKYVERLGDPRPEVRRHASTMIDQIDEDRLPTSFPMPIQVWRLSDSLIIIGLAHEVLSTYDSLIRNLVDELGLGARELWIMGYTNETQGYVAADDVLWGGGYEAGWIDDPGITGAGTSMMAYGWPAPLNASPPGTDPAAPDATETIVLEALRELLAPSQGAQR